MSRDFLFCEETDTKIYPNDIVTISSLPDAKFIAKQGWYNYGGTQQNGWYFVSISDKTIVPMSAVDIKDIHKDTNPIVVESHPEPSEEPTAPEVNYIEIPDSLVTLKGGDIVTISDYPDKQWVIKLGWYNIGTARKKGYYFIDIASRAILPLEDIDITKVHKEVEQASSELRPTLQDMDTEPAKVEFIVIPNTDIRLYDGDIVKISNKPAVKWVVHIGWYFYQNVQSYGWYFVSIKDGEILPVSIIDLTLCTLVTVKTQGSELYDGKTINYTRPFTLADAEVLNRTFITVETIAQRDNLDKHKLVNGRIVRVNDVGGVVVYYAWNTSIQAWEKVDFGGGSGSGIPELIGTEEHPIVLSELEEGLYRVIGVYKIAPHYDLKVTTPIHHLAFVRKDAGEEEDVQIKVINEDEITDYIANYLGNVTFINAYATHQYLVDNYATISYVDAQILALENLISEIVRELPSYIREIADSRIEYLVNPIPESFIRGLFPDL